VEPSACFSGEELANPSLHPTWLIGALFKFLTRILVHLVAMVLTPHPPSG